MPANKPAPSDAAPLAALNKHDQSRLGAAPLSGGVTATRGRRFVLLNVHRTWRFSPEVVPSVSARWGRHWQRWGLKPTAGVEKPSRTVDRLRGRTGKGNVREALVLRIVNAAELKRLSGSRPKMGGGTGSGDVNGLPTHVEHPPVYRGILSPFIGTNRGTW